jgi:tetratricopeptide (TPR) repeat protein
MSIDPSNGLNRMVGRLLASYTRRGFLRQGGLLLALQAAQPRGFLMLNTFAGATPTVAAGCPSPFRTTYPPQLQDIIAKLDPAADALPSEVYVAQIEKILGSWSAALTQSPHELTATRATLSDPIVASSLQPSDTMSLRSTGPLRTERRKYPPAQMGTRDSFLSGLASYLAPFATIEVAELEIYGVRVVGESPLRVDTEVRCDIVGACKDGTREQRVGSWALSWSGDEQHNWMVHEWIMNTELRSRLTGPGFTEITSNCLPIEGPGMLQLLPGIDDWRTALDGACGIDVYGNHGVAVGDIDGSGFDSFYVCQPSGLPNRLYRNRGDGTFEDITESSGTGILDGTASALFVDFLNRGYQDLLVVRTAGPLLFVNQGGGKFQPRPDAFQFERPPEGNFTSAAVADYDRDGFLDVYFCVYSYYQGLNQYQYPVPYYDAQNGPPNFLFRNRGDGTFEDVTASSGVNQNNNRFSFAAAWCDYDNSGWPSLYVANDFGRKNLYHNNGDGSFTDVADTLGVEDYGPGMSTCWLDYDNDGQQDVYVANMWLKEGQRITASERFLPSAPAAVRALYQKHNAGNSLFRNTGHGTFEDKSAAAGSAMGRWSWSCGSWDFDHDGYADLYVANGFVSGADHYDLQSFFWRQVAQRSLASANGSPEYEMAWNAVNELVRADYSWSGYQRNVFFANNHDATFSDVSGVLGLDFRDDSRAFALSDFDHDGRIEFVLKNRTGPQLRILRNDLAGIGGSLAVRLTGRRSNRDGIGAIVTIEAEGKRQSKFVSAGSGFASQHTKELFFGVGATANDVSISVLWPTGAIERHENVPVNHRVEIAEGQKEVNAVAFRHSPPPARKPAEPRRTPAAYPSTSTWLAAPLFGPGLKLPNVQGDLHELSALQGQNVLVCFFTTDCADSRKQLEQLQNAAAELAGARLAVLAVATNGANDRPAVEEFARSMRLSFPILLADERTAGAWNIQYRYVYDKRRNMPVPISFLLDKNGAIIKIYQTSAEPRMVIKDCASAAATPEECFARAMPFPGPYYGIEVKHNYFTYGSAFMEYGYVDESLAAFRRVVESEPNYAVAWFNLGTIYLNKKQYSDARKCLLEAARLNPQDADAWNNLGIVSGELAQYDQALEEFHKAARVNPNYILAVQNMIGIYEFQGRTEDAQKTLEELVSMAPENPDLRLSLANILMEQQENEQARKELEVAIRFEPQRADIINNLGVVLMRLGEIKAALDRFQECQRIAPDFDRPYVNAALIYQRAGQPSEAQQLLEAFLARHPDSEAVRGALDKMRKQ